MTKQFRSESADGASLSASAAKRQREDALRGGKLAEKSAKQARQDATQPLPAVSARQARDAMIDLLTKGD